MAGAPIPSTSRTSAPIPSTSAASTPIQPTSTAKETNIAKPSTSKMHESSEPEVICMDSDSDEEMTPAAVCKFCKKSGHKFKNCNARRKQQKKLAQKDEQEKEENYRRVLREFAHILEGLSFPDKILAITKLTSWEIYKYTGELDFQHKRGKSDNIQNNVKPLTPAQVDRIRHIKNMVQIKITHFRITLTKEDITTLYEGNWLNDKIINLYLKMVEERSIHPNSPFFVRSTSSFFWNEVLTKNYEAADKELDSNRLERFGNLYIEKKSSINEYGLILIPIVEKFHWTLAVIDKTRKQIDYYNSMYDNKESAIPKVLLDYYGRYMKKHNIKHDADHWNLRTIGGGCPQQNNNIDCGVFICLYAENIARAKELTFTQADIPYTRERLIIEIFSAKLLNKCHNIKY